MQHFKVDPVLNINATFHSIQDLRGLTVPKNFPKVQIIPNSLLNSFQSPYFILLLPTSTPNCSISHSSPLSLSLCFSHFFILDLFALISFQFPLYVPTIFPPALFPITSYFLTYYPSFLFLPTNHVLLTPILVSTLFIFLLCLPYYLHLPLPLYFKTLFSNSPLFLHIF